MYDVLLIRYGEIAIKGKNRYAFEKKLMDNMYQALSGVAPVKIERAFGRMYVPLFADGDEVIKRLQRVFGIVSLSPAARTPSNLDDICRTALAVLQDAVAAVEDGTGGVTFKVDTRRADKSFPFDSPTVNREVGAYLLENGPAGLTVDVHNPQLTVSVEIRSDYSYVFAKVIQAYGGLPVGTSGKGVLLLSGGIDSPAAGWLAMKRGLRVVPVHFHSFPFTSDRAKEKVLDLARLLVPYGAVPEVNMIHFTDIQMAIKEKCPPELLITIMRRFMVRLSERVARAYGAEALITGENLGQVASQTLPSMAVTEAVATMPIIRPLVTYDKREIVDLARRIGTYETSIQPYEDCCTIFVPRHPETSPRLSVVERAEEALDINGLMEESLAKSEVVRISLG